MFILSNSGEKRANYFAQIMFKHSLDIEAAFSAESVKMNLIKLLFQKYFSLKGEVLFGRNNVFYKNIQLQNITPAPPSLKSRYYNGLTDSGAKPNFDPTIHFQTIIHILFLSNFGEF